MRKGEEAQNRFSSVFDNLLRLFATTMLSILSARSWKRRILLALLFFTPLILTGALLAKIEFSLEPVDIGTYSVSGPRTPWVIFPGKATVLAEFGGYKLWKRNDPQFGIGG